MRTRGFDKLWRWEVTDELELPDGRKLTVTARRLNKDSKADRDRYAFGKARALKKKLEDPESDEYKEFLLPAENLPREEILKALERKERIQLVSQAQLEFLSPSPSQNETDATTLTERLEVMDEEDETLAGIEEERTDWVETSLADSMAALAELSDEELVALAKKTAADNAFQGEWWTAYSDGCLRLGIFVDNKPFFKDWPTEADDDLKARLLELYRDADAAAFDFSS